MKKKDGPTEVPPPAPSGILEHKRCTKCAVAWTGTPPTPDVCPACGAPGEIVMGDAAPTSTAPAVKEPLDNMVHIDRGRWARLQDLRESALVAHARHNAAAKDAKEKKALAEEADAAFNRAFDQINAPPASLPLLDGLPPEGQAEKNAQMLAQPWVKQILEDLKSLPDSCPVRVVDWDARALEVAGWTKEFRSFVMLYVEQYKRWTGDVNATLDNMPQPPAFLLPGKDSDELVDCKRCGGTGKVPDPLDPPDGPAGDPVTCPDCQGDGTIIVPETAAQAPGVPPDNAPADPNAPTTPPRPSGDPVHDAPPAD